MNKISPSCKLVNIPAKSPGLSRIGPEVALMSTLISLAMICERVVFPNPCEPENKIWSSTSPLFLEASI